MMSTARRIAATQDAATLFARTVRSRGGEVSAGRFSRIEALIDVSMVCGHWWVTDDIALPAAENQAQALTTLKRRALMVPVNGPTFVADRGYAFDGLSQYLDSGFNPAFHAQAMTGNTVRLGAYETVNLQSTTTTFGAFSTGAAVSIRSRSASTTLLTNLSGGAASLTIGADSRYLKVASRAGGSTTVKGWDRGVALSDVTASTQGTLPAFNFYIGARNNAGTPDQFRAATVGLCEWGGAQPGGTSAELAWSMAVDAHMTAIGAI